MVKKIRKKFMAVILTLAMVITLMPAATLPASAADHSVTLTGTAATGTFFHITAEDIFGAELAASDWAMTGFTRPVLSGSSPGTYGDIAYQAGPPYIGADGTNYGEINGIYVYSEQDYYFIADTAGTYTFTAYYYDESESIDDNYNVTLSVESSANTAPTASSVSVGGTAETGQTLTGDYTYDDADGDVETGTTYKWYRAEDSTGTDTAAISGATSTTYELTADDLCKYVCFEVTPSDGTDSGTAVKSGYTGPITAAADETPPSSPTYSPANNATDVMVDVTPTLTFSEALYSSASGTVMDESPTGVIKVYEGTDNTGTALTEGDETDNSHFTVTYDSTDYDFTVTFGADLKNDQSYYIELQADAVYDASGNAISSAEGISFTTVAATGEADFTVSSSVGVELGDATLTGGKYYYTDAAVSGNGIRTILISFSESVTEGDEIVLPAAPTGFTVSDTSNKYTKRINLDSGITAGEVQSYLHGVGFTIVSASQTVGVTVTIESVTTDTFYNIDTEHYYQFISYTAGTTGTWTDAYTAAKTMTYMGRTGYLATVMSKAEDQFLYELSGGATGWLGGTTLTPGTQSGKYYESFSTSSNVDHWYWACGPEVGDTFYSAQAYSAAAETASTSYYYNWGRGVEPNSPNIEQCLTTLVVSTSNRYSSTESGYQGTLFSWNNIEYNRAYASDGLYYARGYFVEYGDNLVGDDGSGSTAFASDSGTLEGVFTATVNVKLDGSASSTPVTGSVELRQSGSTVYTLSGGSGVHTASAANGTYDVYINGSDTGADIEIDGSTASATVNYYTVSFAVSNAGTASGSTISATYDGGTIASGAVVLGGKALVITTNGAGASTYSYAWSGTGTSGQTTTTLTISSLGGAVDAACTVTGTTVGVELGDAAFTGGKYYYTDAAVTGDSIRTILISFSESVTEGDEITLPDTMPDGFTVSDTSNDYTKRINLDSGITTGEVQSYLRGVGFTIAGASQTVSLTVTTENITTDTFYNIDTEHYYQYIPAGSSGITWTAAYDAARSRAYMGRTGYLATVMDLEEDIYLNSLSGGKTGWLGGTIMTNNGDRVTASGTADNSGIYYGGFTDNGDSEGWYWACGPEIGTVFYSVNSINDASGTSEEDKAANADTTADAVNPGTYYNWSRGNAYEPNNSSPNYENCLTTLIISGRTGKHGTSFTWNDIRYNNTDQSSTFSAKGYFVEYGDKLKGDNGSGSTAFASDSGTLYNVYTIIYNLESGTNPDNVPVSYTYGTGVTLPMPTRTGYTFGGWYTDSGFTGSPVTAIGTRDTGSKTYYAKWTENTYAVTVNVRLNGSLSDAPLTGAAELRRSGSTVYTMTGSSGVYTASAVNGTYDIYINGTDTGTDVIISGLAGNVSINYYTVTFTASHGGTASGSSISAAYDGSPLSSGSIMLSGKTLVITATGSGAGYYAYTWSGTGVGGENASAFTITALNRTVDALCTVTGRTTPATYSVLLNAYGGAIGSGSVTFYTYGVGAALPSDVTMDGYTFQGWHANTDFLGSPVTAISVTDTGDKVFHARWMDNETHTVSGTVDDQSGNVSGASVTIRGNGIAPQSTTTDASGLYSFLGIPAGEYNIVASYNGVVQTIIVTVEDSDVSDADITMPTGNKNSILQVAADTPDVVVGYLDQQFSADDNSFIGAGNSVVVRLTVEEQDENIASGAVDIQTAASGQTIGMYLDLTLLKTRSDATSSSTNTLTSSESLLKIIVPYDLTGKTGVVVYRYHGGAAVAMTEVPYSSAVPANECYMVNAAGNQVIIWTQSFSTYAISYLSTYTVSYDGNGATSGGVPSSASVPHGTVWSSPGNTDSLARSGYTFRGWALTAGATSALSTYTVTGDTVFYAVWSISSSDGGNTGRRYTITATAGDGGSISPSGSVSVTSGGSKTFTITADEEYVISDVLVDGKSAGAVGSYTFTNITTAHTVSAVFEKAEETSEGLPFYYNESGNKVFIGFTAETGGEMKYLAPDGVTVLLTPNPKNFTDIAMHWGKTYIGFVTEREIFVGTGGNLFSPDTGMTRAMFATVIGRLYERSYGEVSTSDVRAFTDCDYGDYYGKYVDWAAENGIILGYGNGKFRPGDQITREQMAAILYRFADLLGALPGDMDTALTYLDSGTISNWAENAALYCQTNGIIEGRGDGVFVPQGSATRAEVAAILERFIKNILA